MYLKITVKLYGKFFKSVSTMKKRVAARHYPMGTRFKFFKTIWHNSPGKISVLN